MFGRKWKRAYKDLYSEIEFKVRLMKMLTEMNRESLDSESPAVREEAKNLSKQYEDQLFAYTEILKIMKGQDIAYGLDL